MSMISPEVIQNPYPFYEALRQGAPVFHVEAQGIWLVTRYEDCLHVLRHPETFGQWDGSELASMNPEMAAARDELAAQGFDALEAQRVDTLVTADPPAHTRYRTLMNHAWSAKRTAHDMEPRVREIANRLVDGFAAEGRVDVVRAVAYPLPIIVIAEILGVPESEMETFKRWSDDFVAPLGGNLSKERMIECAHSMREFHEYFAEQLEERRRQPRDDVLTVMVESKLEDGRRLEMPELLSILSQLLVAGNETTTNAIGHAMRLILTQPGLRDELLGDPSLIPNTVEESLRYEAPVQGLFRTVKTDTEVAGVPVPAGASLLVMYGSANRDDAVFGEADRFDPRRENAKRHVAFAQGIHLCLGAPLARRELEVAIETLLTRLPRLRLADQEIRYNPHPLLRGLAELWVEFDPVPAGDAVTAPLGRVGAVKQDGDGSGRLVVTIDRMACGGTGDCMRSLPQVFALDGERKATILDAGSADDDAIIQAAWNCPTSAISVTRDGETVV